jgi:hypothetical protein
MSANFSQDPPSLVWWFLGQRTSPLSDNPQCSRDSPLARVVLSVSFTDDVRVFPSPSGGENKAECVFDAEGAAGACGDW